MNVIGVTGMPGSGKSVVSRVAENLGMKVVRMGDVIRDEAHKRNESPGKVAVYLRKEFGKYVIAERCVEYIKNISANEKQDAEKLPHPLKILILRFLLKGSAAPGR